MAVNLAEQANVQYEIVLTKDELGFLIRSCYKAFAKQVFLTLRAMELENARYKPAAAEREAAYDELCRILYDRDVAEQVLEYYLQGEKSARLRRSAREDEQLKELFGTFKGMTVAPLMAGLDKQAAYTIWQRAGTWAGAMKIAGLQPLTETNGLAAALERYAASQASLELLPRGMLEKLDGDAAAILKDICGKASVKMNYANIDDWNSAKKPCEKCGLKVYDVFIAAGLLRPPEPDRKKGGFTGRNAYLNSQKWRFEDDYVTYQRLCSAADKEKRAAAAGGK